MSDEFFSPNGPKPAERWIVIPRWSGKDGFQHYRDRDPIWIKNYRDLLAKDEYLALTFVQRGILHGLWLEYAASNRQLRDSTLTITRRLGQRVTRASLDALNHAGFIAYSASKPLAPRYHVASPEGETEREEETQDLQDEDQKPFVVSTSSRPPAREPTNGHDFAPLDFDGTLEAIELARQAQALQDDDEPSAITKGHAHA